MSYAAGSRVRVRTGDPDHHTRVPRYVRGHTGVVVAALRKIPPRQRQAIVLYHLAGLSVEEIARETGAAPGTVKARLSRGRQALAPHLAEADPPGPPRHDPQRVGQLAEAHLGRGGVTV